MAKKAKEKVGEVMHEYKQGKLKSGKTGKTVKNPKQAVASASLKLVKRVARSHLRRAREKDNSADDIPLARRH